VSSHSATKKSCRVSFLVHTTFQYSFQVHILFSLSLHSLFLVFSSMERESCLIMILPPETSCSLASLSSSSIIPPPTLSSSPSHRSQHEKMRLAASCTHSIDGADTAQEVSTSMSRQSGFEDKEQKNMESFLLGSQRNEDDSEQVIFYEDTRSLQSIHVIPPEEEEEQGTLLKAHTYYTKKLGNPPLKYNLADAFSYINGRNPDLLTCWSTPTLWEFGPEHTSSGSASYTRKIQAMYALGVAILVTIIVVFPNSSVFIPAIITLTMNAVLQGSVEVFQILLNRRLIERVVVLTAARINTLGNLPRNLSDADVNECITNNPLVFLSADECRQWMDDFSADPPISLQAALWIKVIHRIVMCIPCIRCCSSELIRVLSVIIHVFIYSTPLFWISESSPEQQLFRGSLYACGLFIILFLFLCVDFYACYHQIHPMIDDYFLQKIQNAIYSFQCERQRSQYERTEQKAHKQFWFNRYEQSSHLSTGLLKYHIINWLGAAFDTKIE
jgi:hypothetical protein